MVSFNECKELIGHTFYIKPYPENWIKDPLELIRYSKGVLTFFVKRGRTEVRFDLDEQSFKHHSIYKT
jgi:hypothetical protein